ncbi:hypothetical protein AX15_005769 [Amanita polypyramis BW_CC]|nr:hypothetical protein AX15_005769 [Amanita polypyramis BW_CC]
MVSFSCNGCMDVVKKPKLDQHYLRCKSGFDCIDCSKTFSIPTDWKGHTSCITEAEKYQKSLYKGPKTGDRSSSHRGGANSRGRGRGGAPPRGDHGGGQGHRRIPYAATGSNGTPLGSPHREFGTSSTKEGGENTADRTTDGGDTTENVQSTQPDTAEANGKKVGKEGKKNKKRKETDYEKVDPVNEPANKKVKVEKANGTVEAAPITVPDGSEAKGRKKKRKEENIKEDGGKEEKEKEKSMQKAAKKEEKKKAKAAEKEEKKAAEKVKKDKAKAVEGAGGVETSEPVKEGKKQKKSKSGEKKGGDNGAKDENEASSGDSKLEETELKEGGKKRKGGEEKEKEKKKKSKKAQEEMIST